MANKSMTKKEREFVDKKDRAIVKVIKDKDDPFFHDEFHDRIKKLGKGKDNEHE